MRSGRGCSIVVVRDGGYGGDVAEGRRVVESVWTAQRSCPCLQGHNDLGPEGAGHLAGALSQLTGLHTLDLVRRWVCLVDGMYL